MQRRFNPACPFDERSMSQKMPAASLCIHSFREEPATRSSLPAATSKSAGRAKRSPESRTGSNAKTGLGRFCISFPERLTEKAKATCAVPWPLPWQRLLSPLSWHEPQPCRQPPPGPLPWQRLLWLLPPKACQLGRSAMVRALR